MAKIKIAVAGCLGRMGQEISKQILKYPDERYDTKSPPRKMIVSVPCSKNYSNS